MSTPPPPLSRSSLACAALLALVPAAARADRPPVPAASAPEDPTGPVDAPPECVDPVPSGETAELVGLSERLLNGPRKLGTYKLVDGKALDTPKLRLIARGKFIPARVGAKEGEVVASMAAALLPDVDRDGENPENSVEHNGLGAMRVGSYRVTMRVLEAKPGSKPIYEAVVEEMGCPEKAVHPPLGAGAHKTFWISTEAVASYSFSRGEWYESVPRTYVALTADLDPSVQQTPGQRPRGWINVQALESQNGVSKSEERLLDQLDGAVMTLPEHKVEILKVALGAETERAAPPARPGQVVTNGKPPSVSVLVRLTRTADASATKSKSGGSKRKAGKGKVGATKPGASTKAGSAAKTTTGAKKSTRSPTTRQPAAAKGKASK
jgi:hypothetical protein